MLMNKGRSSIQTTKNKMNESALMSLAKMASETYESLKKQEKKDEILRRSTRQRRSQEEEEEELLINYNNDSDKDEMEFTSQSDDKEEKH